MILMAGLLWHGAVPAGLAAPDENAAPVWAVDPHEPGASLPPAGRSLFDFLTIREEAGARVQRVPFPFAALLAEIEARLGHRPGHPGHPGDTSPLKRVLIPLGRSLQRSAAEPEFFRYPRAVVAVDTEGAGMFLKDRLYLGYHEKAEILEVISYNEAAGRFEFQLVRDYRSGGAAQVVNANRAVCTACHQGGGPLFSRQLWDETNANPEIARLLAAERRDFYGFPIDPSVEVPNAIDAATDRANRIAVYQLLWREGCGSGETERAIRCRAAAFTAALQHRLSGGLHRESDELLSAARRAWEARWPNGLAIPDPDIPNHDPLAVPRRARVASASVPVTLSPAEMQRQSGIVMRSHVPAAFEPLNPRPPLEVWTADQAPARLVTGLAGLLADEDVRRLDQALFVAGSRPEATRTRLTLPCTVSTAPRAAGERLKFLCGSALEGRIYLEGTNVTGGTIERLELKGGTLRDLDVVGGTASDREAEIALAQKLTGLHARGAFGDAVESVRLNWSETSGEATVVSLADFASAATAIEKLAAGSADVFSSRPFRRTAVLGALFAELGLERPGCCLDDRGMPPPVLELTGAAGPDDFPEPEIRTLYQYCARCHASPEVSPPNFLYGDAKRVRANLAHCAERIFYRLDVWSLPPEGRPKTPMPPLGLAPEAWPEDPALALLRRYAAGLIKAETGKEPRFADLDARGYENLTNCLAPVMASAR